MSWSVPSCLATQEKIKVPCSTMSILPNCHCLTQRWPRACPRVVVSWGTVLPLISVLAVKIRAARNCISQLCQWLWVNRWSFCQFLAAALLISHFLAFCALVKETAEFCFGWVTIMAGNFFYSISVQDTELPVKHWRALNRETKRMVGVEKVYIVDYMM